MPGILILHTRCLILLLLCQFQPANSPTTSSSGLTFISDRSESLDWMVLDAPIVLRGNVKSSTDEELIVEITESIKGASQVGVWMRVSWIGTKPTFVKGTDVLLCLDNTFPVKNRFVMLQGRMSVTLMDVRNTSDPDEILRVARQQATQPAQKSRTLGLATGSLVVPVNKQLEELGQKWATDTAVHNRLLAIQALRPFKSPQNIALIEAFLDDTRALSPAGFLGFGGKWKRGYYIVRSDAADLLSDWGVPIPDLPNGGPILPYRPLEISMRWLIASIAALCIWLIAAFFLRARLLRLTFLIACVVIAAASIFGWIRSRQHVDEIMFASKASHHELASYDSGLQYVILRNWTEPRGAFVGHFDRAITEDLWSIEGMHRSTTYRLFGFAFTRGRTPGPDDKPLPYTLLRIPYWAPSLPLLAFVLRQLFISVRSARRRRLGLCCKCGYDLRETPTGICPECGSSMRSTKTSNEVPIGGHGIGV